jgi:4-aminobutyrate aminotransferase-like enzyme
VLRFIPALNVSDAEIDAMLDTLNWSIGHLVH